MKTQRKKRQPAPVEPIVVGSPPTTIFSSDLLTPEEERAPFNFLGAQERVGSGFDPAFPTLTRP